MQLLCGLAAAAVEPRLVDLIQLGDHQSFLGKPLGVGVLSAALKKEQLSDAGYRQLIDTTTKLNTPGIALAQLDGVHALTDITGFGLAGHTLELARGAKLTAVIEWSKVPLLDGVEAMAAEGFVTGASGRNFAVLLPVWDWIFRTGDWRRDHFPPTGVPGVREELATGGWFRQQVLGLRGVAAYLAGAYVPSAEPEPLAVR